MAITKILAANLRTLREMHGRLIQQELAQRVGVSRRTIARLENAEVADPGVEHVRSLAAAFSVPFELLLTRRLTPVTLPVPEEHKDRLKGPDGAKLLARLIRALDDEH
ncbi:MAG: helix-turn-helix transcriptional regulator [Myxococcota bacterium]